MTHIAVSPRIVEMADTTAHFARSAPEKRLHVISRLCPVILHLENTPETRTFAPLTGSPGNYLDLTIPFGVAIRHGFGIQSA